jgi:hypothetical protein
MGRTICNGCVTLLFTIAVWAGGQIGFAQTYCGNQQSALLGNASQYQFQGNQWNRNFLSVKQCVAVTDSKEPPPAGPSAVNVGAAFHDTTGTPADYPYFLYGCFRRTCTRNTHLPIRVDALPQWSITSGVTVTQPSRMTNDIAYDIWFTQTRQTPPGRNTDGTELMIWVQHLGFARPIGCCRPVLRFTDSHGIHWSAYAGYNKGNCAGHCGPGVYGTQVISFLNDDGDRPIVNQPYLIDLNQFFHAAQKAGQIQPSWYLQSIGFGTEIWVGGPGLAYKNFWVKVAPQGATTLHSPKP